MVVVPVAEDECVDTGGIDLEERHVVGRGRLREAVVEEEVAGLAAQGRLQVEAEAEFAVELLRRQPLAHTEAVALDLTLHGRLTDRGGLQKRVVGVVDDRPHRQTVNDGRGALEGDGRRRRDLHRLACCAGGGRGALVRLLVPAALTSDESPGEHGSPRDRTQPKKVTSAQLAALVHASPSAAAPRAGIARSNLAEAGTEAQVSDCRARKAVASWRTDPGSPTPAPPKAPRSPGGPPPPGLR